MPVPFEWKSTVMETPSQCVNTLFAAHCPRLANLIIPINQSASSKLARAVIITNFPFMPELTNLTDRISHLRDRKTSSPIIQGDPDRERKPPELKRTTPEERRLATDYFMIFVYALLAIAVLSQFVLILCLDVL